MPQMPEPLMRGNEALHVAPSGAVRRQRPARQHHLQNVQQLLGHLEIRLVAGMVERDQDLVRQATRVTGGAARPALAPRALFALAYPVSSGGTHVVRSRLSASFSACVRPAPPGG